MKPENLFPWTTPGILTMFQVEQRTTLGDAQ
jgi:hypothetical protein